MTVTTQSLAQSRTVGGSHQGEVLAAGSVSYGELAFQWLALGVSDFFGVFGGGMLLSRVVLETQVAKSLLEM